jgi:hypothetical protein
LDAKTIRVQESNMKSKFVVTAAAIGAALCLAAAPAQAQRHHGHIWHGGGWGAGAAGFAAGALIGGALASRPYYGPGYYNEPSYAYVPAPGYGPGAVAYCVRRFKSYDPASGTYLGNDGYRHPCP